VLDLLCKDPLCELHTDFSFFSCLHQVVKEVIDPAAKIEFHENTADDPHKRKPDITKAKDLLGWEPKVSLREGLPHMVSDFRNRIFGDQKEESSPLE
jgi:UDP-glucuronate decarboxylase